MIVLAVYPVYRLLKMETIQNDSVSLAIYYMVFLGKLWQICHLWRAKIRITVLIVIIIHGLFCSAM